MRRSPDYLFKEQQKTLKAAFRVFPIWQPSYPLTTLEDRKLCVSALRQICLYQLVNYAFLNYISILSIAQKTTLSMHLYSLSIKVENRGLRQLLPTYGDKVNG